MLESILLLWLMALLLIGAPGPAAMALAATGASYPLKRGLPLVAGLLCGAMLTGLLTTLGMLQLLAQWPAARTLMQIAGVLFILLLALQMLRAGAEKERQVLHFGFRSGVLMNLLNPKAYAVFMVLSSQFLPPLANPWLELAVLEAVSALAAVLVASSWLLLGRVLGQLITSPAGKHRMRQVFVVLMIAFIVPVLIAIPGGSTQV